MTDDHQPVMVEEVLAFLRPTPDGVYLDCTVGAGGHSDAILRATGGRCTILGLDRDPHALARARHNLRSFGGAVKLARTDFSDLAFVVESHELEHVDGILLDLGMSSMQIDDASRGFSFRQSGPLDMRMDPEQPLTAAEVVNTYPEFELRRILKTYGEERYATQVARAIAMARRRGPLRTTADLVQLLESSYPARDRRQHPARRTFQALRIEVNGELKALESALRSAPDVLSPGGRIVVLSYHSLEDKLTKRIFTELSGRPQALAGLGTPPAEGVLGEVTRNAVLPGEAEIERNPRASAARLRAAERRRTPR